MSQALNKNLEVFVAKMLHYFVKLVHKTNNTL